MRTEGDEQKLSPIRRGSASELTSLDRTSRTFPESAITVAVPLTEYADVPVARPGVIVAAGCRVAQPDPKRQADAISKMKIEVGTRVS